MKTEYEFLLGKFDFHSQAYTSPGFAFRGLRTLKQKHRSAFQVLSHTQQWVCLGTKI